MAVKLVPGFKPSTNGFHFTNQFSAVPLLTIPVLGQNISIGDASKGMCGGMVFAVRDFFESGVSMWPDTTAPSSGPLFDYIARRLIDSFNLTLPTPPPPPPSITPTPPFGPGPATYMWLMDPALPDHETVASGVGAAPHGRAWVMIVEEWPKIQSDIDNNTLAPMGLIEIKSTDPTMMGKNHQVLAYGYRLNSTDLTIFVYDPNYPDNDNVSISLSIADPAHTTAVTRSTGETTWCYFRSLYAFSTPPAPPTPPATQCFIATAACGADAPEVCALRAFRDQCLMPRPLGRAFVSFYQRISPPLAGMVAQSSLLKAAVRRTIVSPAHHLANRALRSSSCARSVRKIDRSVHGRS